MMSSQLLAERQRPAALEGCSAPLRRAIKKGVETCGHSL